MPALGPKLAASKKGTRLEHPGPCRRPPSKPSRSHGAASPARPNRHSEPASPAAAASAGRAQGQPAAGGEESGRLQPLSPSRKKTSKAAAAGPAGGEAGGGEGGAAACAGGKGAGLGGVPARQSRAKPRDLSTYPAEVLQLAARTRLALGLKQRGGNLVGKGSVVGRAVSPAAGAIHCLVVLRPWARGPLALLGFVPAGPGPRHCALGSLAGRPLNCAARGRSSILPAGLKQ